MSPDEDEPTKIILKPELFSCDGFNYQDEAYFELFSKFGLSNLEPKGHLLQALKFDLSLRACALARFTSNAAFQWKLANWMSPFESDVRTLFK